MFLDPLETPQSNKAIAESNLRAAIHKRLDFGVSPEYIRRSIRAISYTLAAVANPQQRQILMDCNSEYCRIVKDAIRDWEAERNASDSEG